MSKTERRRPDVALGGMVDALSFPQHELKSEAQAVQKHQPTDVTAQVRIEVACSVKEYSRE